MSKYKYLIYCTVLLLLPIQATAEAPLKCTPSEWFEEEYQDHTPYENLDLSEPIDVKIRGVAFRIPHGYHRWRFKKEHLETYTDERGETRTKTKLGQRLGTYMAWMPSGEWPHFRTSAPIFRDCSDPQKHAVRFRIENPFLGETVFRGPPSEKSGPPDPKLWFVSPALKWKNGIEGFRKLRQEALRDPDKVQNGWDDGFIQKYNLDRGKLLEQIVEPYIDFEAHGLRGVYRKSSLDLPNSSFTYREAKGDPRQIHISCISDAWRGAYPFCRGYFYWPHDGLGIQVDFLKDRLPEWDSMVETIHAMVIDWHDDILLGFSGLDRLFGGTGNDTLNGGLDNDALYGDEGNDRIIGGAGDDNVTGGAGFDTIFGGAGNDILAGGFNADTFVFDGAFGADTITDFDVANAFERINLSAVGSITDFADLSSNHLSQVGGNTMIDDGSGNTITLVGVQLAQLTSDDFVF